MSKTIDKESIIQKYALHGKDTGSSEVQVALLTARIEHLTEHLKENRKDYHSRRGLIQMTSRRRKLLDFMKRSDLEKYNNLIKQLKLRR